MNLNLIRKFCSTRTPNITSSAFKPSANGLSNKDCIRLAFIYGMCGTASSYLSMKYDGKVLVIGFSVPTPERFVFCSWCWSLAGMASWRLFWTRPDSLIRAASSRIRYGLFHGTQTTILSLGLSAATISFWSLYFDVKDWQIRYGEWQKQIMTQSISDITMKQNKENLNRNNQQIDDMDSGINIVNTTINNNNTNNNDSDINMDMNMSIDSNEERLMKPMLGRQEILNNAYEPCKLFFLCNAPIWLLTGSMTGMIAARILTNSVSLTPAMAVVGMLSIDDCNQNNLVLLDDE